MSENISVKMGVKLAASLNMGKNLSREGGGWYLVWKRVPTVD